MLSIVWFPFRFIVFHGIENYEFMRFGNRQGGRVTGCQKPVDRLSTGQEI